MSRKRLISPEFFQHGALYDAEAASGLPLRIAFAGLWTVTDRRGVFVWKPRELKLAILPYDSVDFGAVLSALERAGFVERYEAGGKEFGRIPSFGRWQTFHKHEKPSNEPNHPSVGSEPAFGGLEPSTSNSRDVPSTAITGTVAGTGASTVTVIDVDDSGEPDSVPIPEPALTALYLSIWSNGAVAERWGENPSPFTQGSAAALADTLRKAGVEWQVARLAIYRQCRESVSADPPRSVNYFRAGILGDWDAERARRQFQQSGEVPPAPSATVRPSSTAARKSAHDGAGRGALCFTKIRKLVRELQQPGQPVRRFIKRDDVAALGGDVLDAYDAIGGSERVLSLTGETISFAIRDFNAALEAASHVHV